MNGPRATLIVHGLGGRGRGVVHREDGPALLVAIESGVVHATAARVEHVIDRSTCLLVPPRTRVGLRTGVRPGRVVAIVIHEPLVRSVIRTYALLGVRRDALARWTAEVALLPRTSWVHEIVHRYVFERDALGLHDNAATRFLETEIWKEVYFLARDRDDGADRAGTARRHSVTVERALAQIEANLFEPTDVARLATIARASESTLLRAFRRELGCTPGVYWRERRLDEALALLRSGRASVAEVAGDVGYESGTAFGTAFRRRFGAAPSTFLPRRPTRRAP